MMNQRLRISVLPLCVASCLFATSTFAEQLNIVVRGSVAMTELTRGPFANAQVGDPVTIAAAVNTDADIGFGDLHRYVAHSWSITIADVRLTASSEPTFGFSTFASFHGFDFTSGGLLQPGGGVEHEYRVPVFSASGPPTFWLPQGSDPSDHRGVFMAGLFDFFSDNAVVDFNAGGPFIDQALGIAMESIAIGLQLAISGDCPGEVRVTISGATPLGRAAIFASAEGGEFVIPDGNCAGITVDVRSPFLSNGPLVLGIDGTGKAIAIGEAPQQFCSAVNLQAVDGTTCTKSLVEVLGEP